jgi:Polyketide cyclase / dehydrase and lipid transport
MSANDYEFVSQWRVVASVAEVSEIVGDALALPRWWPQVYLSARELEAGHAVTRVGQRIGLHTKGFLPYTLRWSFVVTENREPYGSTIEAEGDFVGRGMWTFSQDGEAVNVRFDWRIRADKPLLRWFSFLFKPLFRLNHAWAMARGEESLKRELLARRGLAERTPLSAV